MFLAIAVYLFRCRAVLAGCMGLPTWASSVAGKQGSAWCVAYDGMDSTCGASETKFIL